MKSFFRCFALVLTVLIMSSCVSAKDVKFTQIHAGSNGPVDPGAFYFEDRNSLENSWVSKALTSEEFVEVNSKIDFDREVLLAFAAGASDIANGPVVIRRIRRVGGRPDSPLDVTARIGGIESGCGEMSARSYPFALAALPRQEGGKPYGGYDVSYFDNGCAPVRTGTNSDAVP